MSLHTCKSILICINPHTLAHPLAHTLAHPLALTLAQPLINPYLSYTSKRERMTRANDRGSEAREREGLLLM